VQEFARPLFVAPQGDVHEADVAPDAVVDVHHGIADLQLRQVLDQRVDVAGLLLLALAARGGRGGKEFGLGDELDVLVGFGPEEALGHRRHGNGVALIAGLELGQTLDRGRLDLAVAQQLEQALAAAFAFGDDEHAVLGGAQVQLQALERVGRAAVDTQVRQWAGPLDGLLAAHREHGMCIGEREEIFLPQEQILRRKDGPLAVVLQETVALAGVDPEALEGVVDVAVQRHRSVRAEVLEDRRRAVEEEGQVVLDAGGGDARADVLVEAHLGWITFDLLAPAGAEGRTGLVVHRELAAGQ
jgi:hypothetical protein